LVHFLGELGGSADARSGRGVVQACPPVAVGQHDAVSPCHNYVRRRTAPRVLAAFDVDHVDIDIGDARPYDAAVCGVDTVTHVSEAAALPALLTGICVEADQARHPSGQRFQRDDPPTRAAWPGRVPVVFP